MSETILTIQEEIVDSERANSVFAIDLDGTAILMSWVQLVVTMISHGGRMMGPNIITVHVIDDNFSGARSVHAVDLDDDDDIDILGAAQGGHDINLWKKDRDEDFTTS